MARMVFDPIGWGVKSLTNVSLQLSAPLLHSGIYCSAYHIGKALPVNSSALYPARQYIRRISKSSSLQSLKGPDGVTSHSPFPVFWEAALTHAVRLWERTYHSAAP